MSDEPDVTALEHRVRDLEADVQEMRKMTLRLAELMDLVEELLVPLARHDEDRLTELLADYQRHV